MGELLNTRAPSQSAGKLGRSHREQAGPLQKGIADGPKEISDMGRASWIAGAVASTPSAERRPRVRLWAGIALIVLGVWMPALLPIEASPVLPHLWHALRALDTAHVLIAAAWLVCVNTVRALPIFLGTLLSTEAATELLYRRGGSYRLAYGLPVILIPLAYLVINELHGVYYHFGTPALLGIVGMLVVHRLAWHTQGLPNKTLIFALFIFGLQWLHVAPVMSVYGFGAGAISRDIKMAALVMDVGGLLNQVAFASSAFTVGLAFIMAKFMVDHARHLHLARLQQRQERELLARRMETLEARTMREMRNLVHDLRGPLSGVQSLLNTVAGRVEDAELKRQLRHTEQAVENMLAMVAEILRADARRVVSASQLMESVRQQFPEEKERLVFHVPSDLPPVRVNLMRLTRALANLIQNALEASEGRAKPVTVRVGVLGDRLRIRIRDYGGGMDPLVLQRSGQPGVSTKGGSGLGIPFAISVITGGHGGMLDFITRSGQGTLALIELPLVAGGSPEEERTTDVVAAQPTGDEQRNREPAHRILAIDDDPAVLFALHALLEEAGWELVPCQSARQGIELWQRGGFDLAILDYRMPEMDGLEALWHMRRHDPETPIVVLTVEDSPALAQRFLDHGASDFVLKPIKPVDLMARLQVHLRTRGRVPSLSSDWSRLLQEKGVHSQTLEAVVDCLRRARSPLHAQEVAAQCHIARPTAYRYLALLEQHGLVRSTMQYGVTGRPRKLYMWRH